MTDSDSAKTATRILKRDAVGRVRTSVRRREDLMDQYERSGLSGPKFAEVAGVCYQTFAGWMQKRRRARGDHASATVLAPSAQKGAGPALVRWVEAEAGQIKLSLRPEGLALLAGGVDLRGARLRPRYERE